MGVDWLLVTGRLAGGIALMLLAMSSMTTALQSALGDRLKGAIKTTCSNRWTAFASGFVVCMLLNSSNAASLLVVHFVAGGAMTLTQALGFCLGINVGGTVQAHLVASVGTADFAPLIIGAGYAASRVRCSVPFRGCGEACMWLGLLFLGLQLIGQAVGGLRGWAPLADALLVHLRHPAAAIAASAAAAAAIQSSNAVLLVVMMLALQGFAPPPTALACVLGANLGTCVSPVLAACGKGRAALRVAVAYLVFKAVAVALVAGAPATVGAAFTRAAEWCASSSLLRAEEGALERLLEASPGGAAAALGGGVGSLEAIRGAASRESTPALMAWAHTLLNALVAALFLPVLPAVAWLAEAVLPGGDGAPEPSPDPAAAAAVATPAAWTDTDDDDSVSPFPRPSELRRRTAAPPGAAGAQVAAGGGLLGRLLLRGWPQQGQGWTWPPGLWWWRSSQRGSGGSGMRSPTAAAPFESDDAGDDDYYWGTTHPRLRPSAARPSHGLAAALLAAVEGGRRWLFQWGGGGGGRPALAAPPPQQQQQQRQQKREAGRESDTGSGLAPLPGSVSAASGAPGPARVPVDSVPRAAAGTGREEECDRGAGQPEWAAGGGGAETEGEGEEEEEGGDSAPFLAARGL